MDNPTEQNILERYTAGDYLSDNPDWHVEDSPWKARQILKMIQRQGLTPGTVCEVGCGAGEILNQLHGLMNNDIQFAGYDISPQAIELARRKTRDRLEFNLQDLIADDHAFFDLLLVIDVFEHVEDYYGFLRSIRDKAEYKIFHIPLDLSAQKVLLNKTLMARRTKVGHIHYFSKDTALATLEDTGYTIVDRFYTSITLDTPATSWPYRIGKIPLWLTATVNKDFAQRLLGGFSLMVLAK